MASSDLLEIARRAQVTSESEARAKRGLSQRSAIRHYTTDRQPPLLPGGPNDYGLAGGRSTDD